MVSLTLGELLLKGADGGFYAISVDENGEIVTTRKQVANDDVGDASINGGEKLIEGSVTAAVLNAQDIFADSAIIRELIAANLDVDTLFAREATITKLNAMDITGNEYLKALVEDGDRKNSGSLTVLADQLASQVKRVQEMQDALTGKADGAALTELATRITQTAEAIRAEVVRGDNLAAGLDEANKALASYKMSFQLDADGVTIAASNSKIDLHLANDRLEFRQNGQVVAYVSNERLYIESAEVTDSLVVGRYEFKRMRDGSLGVLYRVPDESAPTDTSAKLARSEAGKAGAGEMSPEGFGSVLKRKELVHAGHLFQRPSADTGAAPHRPHDRPSCGDSAAAPAGKAAGRRIPLRGYAAGHAGRGAGSCRRRAIPTRCGGTSCSGRGRWRPTQRCRARTGWCGIPCPSRWW